MNEKQIPTYYLDEFVRSLDPQVVGHRADGHPIYGIRGGATPLETVTFDVCDFAVFVMLTDTEGGAASYGAKIDVPGITEFSGLTPELVSAVLKGDCRIMARKTRVDAINASFTYGKLALEVLEALWAGTLTQSATQNKVDIYAGTFLPYFKAVAQITGVDIGVGDAKVILPKASITGGTFIDQRTDQFGQPRVDVQGIGLESGTPAGLMAEFQINNPAVAIS